MTIFSQLPNFDQYPSFSSQNRLLVLHTFIDQLRQSDNEKPKITQKIDRLNEKIKEINLNLFNSERCIDSLTGRRYSKIYVLGFLIELFCNLYNWKLLQIENRKLLNLKNQKKEFQLEIEDLNKSFLHLESTNKQLTDDLILQLDDLTLSQSFSQEELGLIFKAEDDLRTLLEDPNLIDKQTYNDFYNKSIIPLLKTAKFSLTQSPLHFSVNAAAAKGKGAQAAFNALIYLCENQFTVENQKENKSRQEVFLFPDQGAVFKILDDRGQEEECLVNDLLDLISKDSIVGSYRIQRGFLKNFGLQFSSDKLERGIAIQDASPHLLRMIKQHLPDKDLFMLRRAIKEFKNDPDFKKYQKIKKKEWSIKLPNEDWKTLPFNQIQSLFLADQIPCETLIEDCKNQIASFENHIIRDSSFIKALNYIPSINTPSPQLHLIPSFADFDELNTYDFCEQYKWSYIDKNGKQQEVNFKSLHLLYLEKTEMNFIKPIPAIFSNDLPSTSDITTALNVKWKVIPTHLMKIDGNGYFEPLIDFTAKPFIDHMMIMKELSSEARELILNRLSLEGEFNSTLTGEFQFLDFTKYNIGFVPVPNEEYQTFQNLSFNLNESLEPINFQTLLRMYVEGKITPKTKVKYQLEGKAVHKSFKHLTQLKTALDIQWTFYFFDTELAVSEDNELQVQQLNNIKGHLIPFRSGLLETNWKDRPFAEETIEKLLESSDRDQKINHWIKKSDAPIYKVLSQEVQEELEQRIAPILQDYSISELRDQYSNGTLQDLRDSFSEEICNLQNPDSLEIWQMLEDDLSFVTIKSFENLEKIASRYHQDIDELKHLNPESEFKPGEKIKIKYDLTSTSPEVVDKRKRIAKQFYPRLTLRQQFALNERQRKRVSYIHLYKNLFHSTAEKDHLIFQIETYLKSPETPFTLLRREELLNDLRDKKETFILHPHLLSNFKEMICEESQPTYFNLMKVMFPLLGDAYELAKIIHGENEAGNKIGSYEYPLEPMIIDVKSKYPSHSEEWQLADYIEKRIEDHQNPAFFGDWVIDDNGTDDNG